MSGESEGGPLVEGRRCGSSRIEAGNDEVGRLTVP